MSTQNLGHGTTWLHRLAKPKPWRGAQSGMHAWWEGGLAKTPNMGKALRRRAALLLTHEIHTLEKTQQEFVISNPSFVCEHRHITFSSQQKGKQLKFILVSPLPSADRGRKPRRCELRPQVNRHQNKEYHKKFGHDLAVAPQDVPPHTETTRAHIPKSNGIRLELRETRETNPTTSSAASRKSKNIVRAKQRSPAKSCRRSKSSGNNVEDAMLCSIVDASSQQRSEQQTTTNVHHPPSPHIAKTQISNDIEHDIRDITRQGDKCFRRYYRTFSGP